MKFLILFFLAITAQAGNLQNSDFATSAQITGAGGTNAQLLNLSKMWDDTNSQLLGTTVAAKLNTSAFTDAAVTSKLITGYVSGAGVVAATDTILQAINKLNGNIAAIVPGTGDVVGPGVAVNNNVVFFDGVTGKLIKDSGLALSGSNTGDQTITLTSDVTGSGTGSFATTIAANAVTNAKMATMAANTVKANITGGAAVPTDVAFVSTNTVSSGVFRDGSGDFSAGTITAALTGNASTSTALAANPTDCGVGTKAISINASGDLTCSAVSLTADVSGVLPAANLPAPTTSALAALDIDWATLKNVDGLYTKTLSANSTLTFSNVVAGQTVVIAITNTASNYTLAWPAAAKWSGGTAPTQTIGAKTDVYTCKSYDGTNAYCSAVQNY